MIKNGDISAFERLFKEFYEPMYRFAARFVKDPQSAENITQDIFVKLWESKEEISISTNVKAYLFTSVRNHSLNYLKREKMMDSLDFENDNTADEENRIEDKIVDEEIHRAVHKAIDKLPEQCREIYLMNKYDDLSYKEIALIKKISINTVKTQMKRALKALRENLAYLKLIFIAAAEYVTNFIKYF